MFGLFASKPFTDPHLGMLVRRGGLWRGTIALAADLAVPLALSGPRGAPEREALLAAQNVPRLLELRRKETEGALFEHYSPYAESVAAGEDIPPAAGLPPIGTPAEVWPHVHALFVLVSPLERVLTVEVGYRVAWDEEHTVAVRFQAGEFAGLCGSVLMP